MNTERLNELADLLEREEVNEHFDMTYYFGVGGCVPVSSTPLTLADEIYNCDTVACIAGWACALAKEKVSPASISFAAKDWLELDAAIARELFTPGCEEEEEDNDRDPYSVTAKQAAKVVRHLAATGTVDWNVAFEEPTPDLTPTT